MPPNHSPGLTAAQGLCNLCTVQRTIHIFALLCLLANGCGDKIGLVKAAEILEGGLEGTEIAEIAEITEITAQWPSLI